VNRSRHELRCIVAGKTKHQPLVAGAASIHAHGDVRALLVNGHHDSAGVVIETFDVVVVTDVLDYRTNQGGHRDVGLSGNLPGYQHEAGRQQGLAGYPTAGIVL